MEVEESADTRPLGGWSRPGPPTAAAHAIRSRAPGLLDPSRWRPSHQLVTDLGAATVVLLVALVAWGRADPIRIVGGLPQASVGRPQWFSCCEVSNELTWRGVGAALVPVLVAAAVAGWWARPLAVATGALGATALIALGESMASTADVVPWSPQGRAYAVAVALAWPIGAGAAAALAHITRRRLGPR